MKLTARQKELLRSLPRDEAFNPGDFGMTANTYCSLFVKGVLQPINNWQLTPAGQAEWDKLQEEGDK